MLLATETRSTGCPLHARHCAGRKAGTASFKTHSNYVRLKLGWSLCSSGCSHMRQTAPIWSLEGLISCWVTRRFSAPGFSAQHTAGKKRTWRTALPLAFPPASPTPSWLLVDWLSASLGFRMCQRPCCSLHVVSLFSPHHSSVGNTQSLC